MAGLLRPALRTPLLEESTGSDFKLTHYRSSQEANWDDPGVWVGGVVPNSADADVVFPIGASASSVVVSGGQQFITNSINNASDQTLQIDGSLSASTNIDSGGYLNVSGSLSIGGSLIGNPELNFQSGSLAVGSFTSDNYVQGQGTITAGQFINNDHLIGGLAVHAASFRNNGYIVALTDNTTSINTKNNGFENLSNGTLTGGSYDAEVIGSGAQGGSGVLSINCGGTIVNDAASITLEKGTIQCYDNATSQYIPIQASLHGISSSGFLNVAAGSYSFGTLDVAGSILIGDYIDYYNMLAPAPTISSSVMTIEQNGQLSGNGIVDGPIVNNGLITTKPDPAAGIDQILTLTGPVSGNGRMEIAAGTAFSRTTSGAMSELELGGATSQTVSFANNIGELALDAPSTFAGEIAPAQLAGDQVLLNGISESSIVGESYTGTASGGTLTLQQATGAISLNFIGDYNVSSFTLSAGPQQPSTLITVGAPVCFVEGSRIRTLSGDIAVENLTIGDIVITSCGTRRPIRWLGHRTIDCRRHPRPEEALPIRIAAHAFDVDRPQRDLLLSPGHSICVDIVGEVLVPASVLVNGTTITQVAVDTVSYWHVELDSHDIILAENLPTESYLDMANRSFFSNASIVELSATPDAPTEAHVDFCRPYHVSGATIQAVCAKLALRAKALGARIASTESACSAA